MLAIYFIIISSITIILSVKLSIYADNLNKTTKISGAIVGGILIAGITSLPEFITCLTSIYMQNSELAMGDIIGSNLFNIFFICIFDIFFIKKMIFNKTNNTHLKIYILLTINYLFIFLYMKNIITISIFNIGIPSIIILTLYIFYIITIKKEDEISFKSKEKISNVKLKLFITCILMIIASFLLTIIVNKITLTYPTFSSSTIGAILLGITTSLPEVVSFYTLIVIDNYDMAIDDIIGSNLFNLFVLAIGDILLKGYSIYDFPDKNCFQLFFLCMTFNVVSLLQNSRKKSFNKITYIFPSIIMVIIYIVFWISSFID